MNVLDYLLQQYDYVIWADERCVAAAATVPAETYRKDFGFSFGSVHNVLVHMMSAQDVWLGRLLDGKERPFSQPEDVTTLDQLFELWKGKHAEFFSYLKTLTDKSILEEAYYSRRGIPTSALRWKVLTHVFDHATYHRSQLNSLIKLAGGTPGDFSYQGRWLEQAGLTI